MIAILNFNCRLSVTTKPTTILTMCSMKMVHVTACGTILLRAVSFEHVHEDAFSSLQWLITKLENLNSSMFEKRMTTINESTSII